jgi:hypothetical protein
MWLSERSGISRARMLLPDSQIGLTMAVPVDVATGPRGPEPEPAVSGEAIEGRSPGRTGGHRLGLAGSVAPALACSRQGEVHIAIRSRVTMLIR